MLDHRVEGAAAVVRGAAKGDPRQTLLMDLDPQRLDQRALADARLAHHQHDSATPLLLGLLPGAA
jgi:hypothetical protein